MRHIMRKPTFCICENKGTDKKTYLHCFRPGLTQTGLYSLTQKLARGLKFRIYEVEELYYLCSENKSVDQLCGYNAPDQRLCFFRISKKQVFTLTQLTSVLMGKSFHSSFLLITFVALFFKNVHLFLMKFNYSNFPDVSRFYNRTQ